MFKIDQHNIPVVRTRQALLLLDLQNDFVMPSSSLAVGEPSDFVEKIVALLPHFRASGNYVIWVRSQFETSRPVNERQGDSERVITDDQLQPGHRRAGERLHTIPSSKLREPEGKTAQASDAALGMVIGRLEAEDDTDDGDEEPEETFLTVQPGKHPRFVLPSSSGANFARRAVIGFDGARDLIFQKSYYSAFSDGTLMQVMRSKFITEVFLCGALTNMSVFATAMDAARHGYAITILEDCLGYRSKARHDEALRQLAVSTGCDITNSEELTLELQRKGKLQSKHPKALPPRRSRGDLSSLLAGMNLENGESSPDSRPITGNNVNGKESSPPAIVKGPSEEDIGSSDSPKEASGYPKLTRPVRQVEADGQKRERVPTKIRSRRRHSKSGSNDKDLTVEKVSAHSRRGVSPTSMTLREASQALEKHHSKLEADDSTLYSLPQLMKRYFGAKDISPPKNPVLISSRTEAETDKTMTPEDLERWQKRKAAKRSKPDERVTDYICEGDTTVVHNLLNSDLADGIFEKVRDEVRWQKMSHQGGDVPRLVTVQGKVGEDGSIPIYRHPADESPQLLPFSPTISLIQARVEEELGHPVNHVLIQLYRNGNDYISEHSDKTLDIAPKTFIANVSLGAQRTMVFRAKKPCRTRDSPKSLDQPEPRESRRAPLPHNSMCKVGLVTNMRWLHGIRRDKRLPSEKSEEELDFDGARISLTFRLIGTFLDKDEQKIWGQGAVAKAKADARTVINGETAESEEMLKAFGRENQSSDFDWEGAYGKGFDVLHISNHRKLFFSGDAMTDLGVKITLAEYDIEWVEGRLSPSFSWEDGNTSSNASPVSEVLSVKFIDNDLGKSTVIGSLPIMLYITSIYGGNPGMLKMSPADLARQFTRLEQSRTLLSKWVAVPFSMNPFRREMQLWEAYAGEASFIAGSSISLADYALWPILHDIFGEWPDMGGYEKLLDYYLRLRERASISKIVDGESS